MGYFDVEGFAAIEGKQAFWLSRLHAMAGVTLQDGSNLEELLSNTHKSVLDLDVNITAKRHHARLIAIKCPQEVADCRRAQNKKETDPKQHQRPKAIPSKRGVDDLCH